VYSRLAGNERYADGWTRDEDVVKDYVLDFLKTLHAQSFIEALAHGFHQLSSGSLSHVGWLKEVR
jgi:hypothetical protein